MDQKTTGQTDPLFDSAAAGPISQVREGMTVVDVDGQDLGTVERVQMGNAEAATTASSTTTASDRFTSAVASLFGADLEIPAAKRAQLLRYGFIKVNPRGLGGDDRFVRADHIREVSGDTVVLSISGSHPL